MCVYYEAWSWSNKKKIKRKKVSFQRIIPVLFNLIKPTEVAMNI